MFLSNEKPTPVPTPRPITPTPKPKRAFLLAVMAMLVLLPGLAGAKSFTSIAAGNWSNGPTVWGTASGDYPGKLISITGAANNGSGLIRITTAANAYVTGDVVDIAGVLGTTEANGKWTITVIDTTHFDLQASTFTNAYTSAGTVVRRDIAKIIHAVAQDVNATVGMSASVYSVIGGAPTISVASTTVTYSGTGLNTIVNDGDQLIAPQIGGLTRTALSVATSSATVGINWAQAATTFYYNPRAIYILSPGTLTINAGIQLIARGDITLKLGTLTMSAGSHLTFDSSLSGGPATQLFCTGPATAITTANSGGMVANSTYHVGVSYVNAIGETNSSIDTTIITTGTGISTITIPSPPASSGATGWYAYVGQAAGAANVGTRQQTAGSPTAIGTALTLTVAPTSTGQAIPLANNTTINYVLRLSAGEQNSYVSSLLCNGTVGSHCLIDSASGSAFGQIINAGALEGHLGGSSIDSTVNATYTDFTNLGAQNTDTASGSSTFNAQAILINPATAGKTLTLTHCTFTGCGTVQTFSAGLAAGIAVTFCQWFNPVAATSPVSDTTAFFFNAASGSVTGARTFTDNVIAVPNWELETTWQGNTGGWTVQRNVMNRALGAALNPFTLFDTNLIYIRTGNSSTNWSFVGEGGDTLSNIYCINDEGAAELNEHQIMSSDNPAIGGTFTMTGEIFERVYGPGTTAIGGDIIHPVGIPSAATTTFNFTKILALPNCNGNASGRIRMRGDAKTIPINITRCTLMMDLPGLSGGQNSGGILVGSDSSYYGGTNMIGLIQDNLFWEKQIYANEGLPGAGGFGAVYSNQAAASSVNNTVVAAGVTNNAFWNAVLNGGNLYDTTAGAVGSNPSAITGYDGFRQTTKWTSTGAVDVNMGTGTSETTAGPRFKDSTRNFPTFDSAYLGKTANRGAWTNGATYAIGDVVSAQSTGFYNNAVINYRCWLGHTALAPDVNRGQPGASTSTGYRTYWEFATAYDLEQAILAGTTITDAFLSLAGADYITAMEAWVRDGFAPRNAALNNADHLGTGTIGAVAYQSSAPKFRRNPGQRQGTRSLALLDTPFSDLLAEETPLCVLH